MVYAIVGLIPRPSCAFQRFNTMYMRKPGYKGWDGWRALGNNYSLSHVVPLLLDLELLFVLLATGETLLLCPLVVAGEGVWLD